MKPRISRREQILGGDVTGRGNRGIVEQAQSVHPFDDRRRERRYVSPARVTGLCAGTRPARLGNFSASGLQISALVTLGVGDSVAVRFPGRPALGARIVWQNDNLLGLALPEGWIELVNKA